MKLNNRSPLTEPAFLAEPVRKEKRLVDTGKEVVFLEEDLKDRYDGIPASAYSLQNELKDGIKLEKCPTYINLEKMYGSDIAMRTVSKLQSMIEDQRLAEAAAHYRSLSPVPAPSSNPAPSAEP